jgi:Ca-activated chloride channel family protein
MDERELDERTLREILNAEEIPPADENARKRAMNLALAAFDDVQKEKANEKDRQGFGFLGRLTGRLSTRKGDRPVKHMNTKILYGGMATAMAVVLAVMTYRTMPFDFQTTPQSGVLGKPVSNESPDRPVGGKRDDKARVDANQETETRPAEQPVAQQKPATTKLERDTAMADRAQEARPAPAPATPPAAGAASGEQSATSSFRAIQPRAESEPQVFGQFSNLAKQKSQAAPTTDRIAPPQYEATGRDKFESVDENAVKQVTQDPVSTFSVDVDTASYSFVRRKLMQGTLPQKDAVRVEELINYFDYDYPLPETKEQPFRPSVTVMPSPWKDGNKLIQIGIKGYDLTPAEKPRSNLVFLLDVSGSMRAADKLPLMINSMKLLLDTLTPDDTVAIVTYAGRAGTLLEPTKVSDKRKILAALERLSAGGSTAGAAGIRQAYALAEGNFDKVAVNRVILATDGDFNVGITNREELKGFIERKRRSGVFLSVLGFGQGNLNDQLMQDLAQNGNGVAAHIDTLNEARKVLVDEATGMLFPIAKDVKIQVEFNPKTVSEYRLIGYETRALKRQDFNNDKIDAGDIGAGHTVTAIYEITPVNGGTPLVGQSRYQQGPNTARPAQSADFADEYAFLKIRYKLPEESTSKLITTPITTSMERDDASDIVAREASWAAAVAGFGQILKGGTYTGDFSYDDVTELARTAKGDDAFGYRAEFLNLVRLAKSASALPRR